MLLIEITKSLAKSIVKSGTSTRTGKDYSMLVQSCYVHMGGEYPQRMTFNLPDGYPAYEEGFYIIDDASFFIGQFEKLHMGALFLNKVMVDGNKKIIANQNQQKA